MKTVIQSVLSSSAEEIFEALRDDIVFGRLNPRERLVESNIATRFKSHRAAVREALAALEQAGLVDRPRNKGASVRDVQPEQVEQIYAVRMLLETAAIGAIPLPMPAAALNELVAIQREHEKAVKQKDLRRVFHHNNRFHRHLYSQSGNPVLVEMIEQCATRVLTVRFNPYMEKGFLERVCQDHWKMIDACRESDRPRLAKLISEHLPLAKDRYLASYRDLVGQGGIAKLV